MKAKKRDIAGVRKGVEGKEGCNKWEEMMVCYECCW